MSIILSNLKSFKNQILTVLLIFIPIATFSFTEVSKKEQIIVAMQQLPFIGLFINRGFLVYLSTLFFIMTIVFFVTVVLLNRTAIKKEYVFDVLKKDDIDEMMNKHERLTDYLFMSLFYTFCSSVMWLFLYYIRSDFGMKDGLISIHGFIGFAVLVMTMILFRQYNRSTQFEDGFNSLFKSLDNYKYSIPSKPLEQRIAISKDSTLVIRHLVLNEDDLENIREMFQ